MTNVKLLSLCYVLTAHNVFPTCTVLYIVSSQAGDQPGAMSTIYIGRELLSWAQEGPPRWPERLLIAIPVGPSFYTST